MRKKLLFTLLGVLSFSVLSFSNGITISGAASLKGVLEEINEKFKKENKGVKINLNLGGSGALKNQVAAGAPVDIVFFASKEDLKDLAKQHLIEKNYQKDILKNRLVVAGRTNIQNLNRLIGNKVAIGTPETVPAGKYAKEALINSGIFEKLNKDLIFTRDVRSAAQYVDLYEVDFAFIYETDARVLKNSEIVYTVPENLYSPIIYSYGIVNGRATEENIRFYEFLSSDTAKKIYEKHNFTVIE